jgi:hypothetical protein
MSSIILSIHALLEHKGKVCELEKNTARKYFPAQVQASEAETTYRI